MPDNNSPQILGPGESGHSVSVTELPRNALKAIISKLNERSQSATRSYRGNYDIATHDLKHLLDKIHQEFSGRTVINASATVSLFLSKGQRHDFRNWKEFTEFDTTQIEKTRSLSLEVTIDVFNQESELPERYQAQIAVQNNPSEFGFVIGPISFGPSEHAGIPGVPIQATVHFNNYIIGKNILSTIDNWHDNLKKREKDLLSKFKRWSATLREALTYCGTIAGIWFGQAITSNTLADSDWQVLAALYASIVFSFWQIAKFSGAYSERFIDRRQDHANLIVTTGDHRAEERRLKNNQSYFKKSFMGLIVVAFQISVAVMAEPIIMYFWE